jgi:hypothetical protein
MSVQGGDTMTAETIVIDGYQGHLRAKPAFGSARIAALRAGLSDLWPITTIVLAFGLTLGWTGLLMSLLWWGIERLI